MAIGTVIKNDQHKFASGFADLNDLPMSKALKRMRGNSNAISMTLLPQWRQGDYQYDNKISPSLLTTSRYLCKGQGPFLCPSYRVVDVRDQHNWPQRKCVERYATPSSSTPDGQYGRSTTRGMRPLCLRTSCSGVSTGRG